MAYKSLACVKYYNHSMVFELRLWSDHFLVGSSYMTVAISLERYLGICHPNLQFSRRSLVFILPVLLLSITYYFLKFDVWSYLLPLDRPYKYEVFHFSYPIILQFILPLIALLLLNGFII